MMAQRSNCNLFVLFGVSVVYYILRVVPQDEGGFYYVMGW